MTRLGQLLRADVPCSMRAWTLQWGGEAWQVWANLLHSIKTGQSARALITGDEGFEHLERDPEAAKIFNQAMVDLTRLAALISPGRTTSPACGSWMWAAAMGNCWRRS